jgi:hypothetical protein
MKRLLAVAALLLAGLARADSIIIVGAGNPAPWDTEIEIANPTGAPLEVQLGALPDFEPVVCGTECIIVHYVVPPNGSITLASRNIPNIAGRAHLSTVYVTTATEVLPVVRARVFNGDKPQQAVEVPAVRLSTIADVRLLDFPAIIRTADAHTNLVVARPLRTSGPLRVRVEAFNPSGELLATGAFAPTLIGNYEPNLFIVDVLGALGIPDLADGHLRVTTIDGEPLWGFTSVVFPQGSVSQVVGWNP